MYVDIVPVGDVSAAIKREASNALRSVFDCEVTVQVAQSVPQSTYDPKREQYRAEKFVDLAARVGEGEKNLAITPEDLYYHRLNHVFGLAYLEGTGSVISTYHLQTAADGGIANASHDELFAERIRKEAVHEIGHTIGLEHCDNQRCVMNFSSVIREVDEKESTLCGTCQRQVRSV